MKQVKNNDDSSANYSVFELAKGFGFLNTPSSSSEQSSDKIREWSQLASQVKYNFIQNP
jgi:hypothetical protein